jgi:hypothetical protein
LGVHIINYFAKTKFNFLDEKKYVFVDHLFVLYFKYNTAMPGLSAFGTSIITILFANTYQSID